MNERSPKDCASMAELRVEIDKLDVALVDLLAKRSQFIDRAIELKRIEDIPARAAERVEEVITNVMVLAGARGLDESLVENLWRELIEWAILRESKHLDK